MAIISYLAAKHGVCTSSVFADGTEWEADRYVLTKSMQRLVYHSESTRWRRLSVLCERVRDEVEFEELRGGVKRKR